MKGTLLAGVLGMALWGGAALAEDYGVKSSTSVQQQPSSIQSPSGSSLSNPNCVNCPTSNYGGSGLSSDQDLNQPSSLAPQNMPSSGINNPDVNVNVNNPPAQPIVVKEKDNRNHMRGVSVLAGAGVEGYSGSLAPQVRPGPAWGVNVDLRPSKVFGIELGYSGATNELGYGGGIARGADVIRNGGRALATLGLTAAPVQPYLAAGVGVDRYNVRGGTAAFRDDTAGSIPLGVGLRTHIRNFTADARFGTSLLFDNQFASSVGNTSILGIRATDATRYQGTIMLGSSF